MLHPTHHPQLHCFHRWLLSRLHNEQTLLFDDIVVRFTVHHWVSWLKCHASFRGGVLGHDCLRVFWGGDPSVCRSVKSMSPATVEEPLSGLDIIECLGDPPTNQVGTVDKHTESGSSLVAYLGKRARSLLVPVLFELPVRFPSGCPSDLMPQFAVIACWRNEDSSIKTIT